MNTPGASEPLVLCTAKRSNGEPCKRRPVRGANVCPTHGGRAPQVMAAARRRVAEQEAVALMAKLDVAPADDPLSELSKVAGQVLAWRDTCAGLVNRLQDDLRYSAQGAGTEQLRAEVELFERALDRCVSTLGLIAKLNIDERLAKISERQVDAVVRAIDAVIDELGATGVEAERARQAGARELRIVR